MRRARRAGAPAGAPIITLFCRAGACPRRLSAGGIDPERDVSLTVAPRKECGPVFRLERGRDMVSFPLREGAALC